MFFTLFHHLNIQNPKGLTKASQKLRFGPLTIVILAKIFQIQHYVNEMRTGSKHVLPRTKIVESRVSNSMLAYMLKGNNS